MWSPAYGRLGGADTRSRGVSAASAIGLTGAAGAELIATGSATVAGIGISAGSGGGVVLSAGTASLAVPVAGWIVGAGLLTAGGIAAIVAAAKKKGRKRADEIAAQYGPQGKAFVRKYFKSSRQSPQVILADANSTQKKLERIPDKRSKKRQKLVDELNAMLAVLKTRVQTPAAPAVADDPTSTAVAAQSAPAVDWEAWAPWIGGGLLAAAAAVAVVAGK